MTAAEQREYNRFWTMMPLFVVGLWTGAGFGIVMWPVSVFFSTVAAFSDVPVYAVALGYGWPLLAIGLAIDLTVTWVNRRHGTGKPLTFPCLSLAVGFLIGAIIVFSAVMGLLNWSSDILMQGAP